MLSAEPALSRRPAARRQWRRGRALWLPERYAEQDELLAMGWVTDSGTAGSRTGRAVTPAILQPFGANHEWGANTGVTLNAGAISQINDQIGAVNIVQATGGNQPGYSAGPPAVELFSLTKNLAATGGGSTSPIDITSNFGIALYVDVSPIPNDAGFHVYFCVGQAGGTSKIEVGYFPTGATTGLAVARFSDDGGTNAQATAAIAVAGKGTIVCNRSGSTLQVNWKGGTYGPAAIAAGTVTHNNQSVFLGCNQAIGNTFKGNGYDAGTKTAAWSLADSIAIEAAFAAAH